MFCAITYAQTPPFLENFDSYGHGGSVLPNGWVRETNYDMGEQPHLDKVSINDDNVSLYIGCGIDNTQLHYGRVYSSRINTPHLNQQWIRFKARANARGAKLVVGISERNNDRYNPGFVAIDTIEVDVANQWNEYLVCLENYQDTGHYVVLQMVRNMQPSICYFYIDDLIIEPCGIWQPRILHKTAHSLTVSYTTYGNGSITGEYGPTGFAVGQGTPINGIINSPFTIGNLSANTEYEIRLNCSCDGVQNASSPQSIIGTTENSFNLPANYCETFEENRQQTPTTWPPAIQVGDGQVTISSQQSYRGDFSLKFTAKSGQSPIAILPEITNITTSDLEFRMMVKNATTNNGYLVIGSILYTSEPNSFVGNDTIHLAQTNNWEEIFFSINRTDIEGYPAIKYVVESPSTQTIYVDNLSIGTCLIHHIIVNAPTDHELNISWEGPQNIKLGVDIPGFEMNAENITIVTEDDIHNENNRRYYTIRNLAADANYEIELISNCNTGQDYCSMERFAIHTMPQQAIPTYCESFENNPVGGIPDNWIISQAQSSYPSITDDENGKSLKFFSSRNTYSLISTPPLFSASVDSMTVRFKYKSTTTTGAFIIGVMVDPYNKNTFEPISEEIYSPTINTWNTASLNLSNYHGDGHCIAIKYLGSGYGQIDDWQIGYCDIDDIHLYDITDSSISVIWHNIGYANSTIIEYGLVGFTPGEGTLIEIQDTAEIQNHTLKNLVPNTQYDIIVRNQCYVQGSQCSDTRLTATTLEHIPQQQYCITIDSSLDLLPAGWQKNGEYYILPKLETNSLQDFRISIYGKSDNNTGQLIVGILSQPYDLSTFQPIQQYNLLVQQTEYSASLTNSPLTNGYIAIKFDTTEFHLKKLQISACQIYNIQVSNIGAKRATILWNEPSQQANLEYRILGAPEWTTLSNITSPTTLFNLLENTNYEIKVWGVCDDQEDCLPKIIQIHTEAESLHNNYCNNFENNNELFSLDSTIVVSQEQHHSGNTSINLNSLDSYIILPSTEDTAISGDILSFWTLSTSNSLIQVGTMTDPYNHNSFVASQTILLSNIDVWNKYQVVLNNTNSGLYIAIRCIAGQSYIDDIALNSCDITNVRFNNIGTTSLVVSWDTVGNTYSGDGVWVYYPELSEKRKYTENPFTIDGLSPDSIYDFQIWTSCRDTECISGYYSIQMLGDTLPSNYCAYTPQNEFPTAWREININGQQTWVLPKFDNDYLYLSFSAKKDSLGSIIIGSIASPYLTETYQSIEAVNPGEDWNLYEVQLSTSGYITIQLKNQIQIDSIGIRECSLGNINVKHITQNSAYIEWSGNASSAFLEYSIDSTNANSSIVEIPYSGYTINGLEPASYYTLHFWPTCGDTNTDCNYKQIKIQTLHPQVEVPYCENFIEDLANWRSIPNDYTISSIAEPYHGSSPALKIKTDSPHSIAIMPDMLDLSDTCMKVKDLLVNLWCRFSTTLSSLDLGVMSDVYDSNTFEVVCSIIPGAQNSWEHHILNLSNYTGNGKYLAWRINKDELCTEDAFVIIDDICVERCIATNFRVYNVNENSVTIAWNSSGVDSVECEYGPRGFHEGTGTSVMLTSSPYVLEGLGGNNSYTFYFKPICGCGAEGIVVNDDAAGRGGGYVNNSTDSTSASTSTSTQSGPYLPPTCESFEGYPGRNFPTSWSFIAETVRNYPRLSSEEHFKGNYSLEFFTTNEACNIASMPRFSNEQIFNSVASFYAYTNDESIFSDSNYFFVGVITNPYDTNTFTPVDTITLQDVSKWQRFIVDLNKYSGNNGSLSFKFAPHVGNYSFYIDNVEVQYCNIENIQFSHITDTSLTISWDTINNVSNVAIEYGHSGFNYGTGTIVNTSNTSILINNLDLGYNYDFYFSTGCNGSRFRGCAPPLYTHRPLLNIPYCISATDNALSNFAILKHSNDSPIYDTLTESILFTPSDINQNSYNMVLLPTFKDHSTLNDKYIKLKLMMSSTQSASLEIGYLTDTSNARSFVTLKEIHCENPEEWFDLVTHISTLDTTASNLVLRATSSNGVQYIYVKELSILNTPSPLNVHTIETGYKEKHILWDYSEDDAYCAIEYGLSGFTPGSGTIVNSDSCLAIITNLQPNTDYEYYFVRNGSYDCQSYTFHTSQPIDVPYCSDFSYNYDTTNAIGWTIFPEPNVENLNHLSIKFKAISNNNNTQLQIGTIFNIDDKTTFEPIFTTTIDNYNNNSHIFNFNNYLGNNKYIAIKNIGGDITISNLELTNCLLPEISIVDASTIKFSLEESADINYYITYNNTTIHVTENPFYLQNLTSHTHYQITTHCDINPNNCSQYQTIVTPYEANLPLCEDFNQMPEQWTTLTCVPGYPNSQNNLHFSGNNATTFELAVLPYINTSSYDKLYLNCDYKIEDGAKLILGYLSNPQNPNTFVGFDTLLPTNDWRHTELMFEPTSGFIAIGFVSNNPQATSAWIDNINLDICSTPTYTLIGYNTIEVNLTNNNNVQQYYIQQILNNDTNTLTITENPYRITNLNELSNYEFIASCDNNISNCNKSHFIGTSTRLLAPFCETFTAPLQGWFGDSIANGKLILTNNRFTILPELDIPENTNITISGNVYSSAIQSTQIVIGMMYDPIRQEGFTSIDTLTITSHGVWSSFSKTISIPTTNGKFLSFKPINIENQDSLLLDDLIIETCQLPQVHLYDYNNILIEQSSEVSNFYVEYGLAGFAQGEGEIIYIEDSLYQIQDLNSLTTYDIYVRCDNNATCRPPIKITTSELIQLPACFDFDTNTSVPLGWNTGSNYNGYPKITDSEIHLRGYNSQYQEWISLPVLETPNLNNITLSFDLRTSYLNGEAIVIGVLSDPNNILTFTPIDTISANLNKTHYDIRFNQFNGDGVFVTFRLLLDDNNRWRDVFIDNISIDACILPYITLNSHNSIKFETLDSSNVDFYVQYHLINAEDSEIQQLHITSNPYILDNLEEDTTYYIWTYCNSNDQLCKQPTIINTDRCYPVPYCTSYASEPLGYKKINGTWLLPEFRDITLQSIHISSHVMVNNDNQLIEIGLLTDYNNYNSFIPTDTIIITQPHQWQNLRFAFETYEGTGKFIAIRTSSEIYLKDLRADRCFLPESIAFTTLNGHQIEITWNEAEGTGFYLAYKADTIEDDSYTYVRASQSPITLTLDYNTNYNFYLMCTPNGASCGAIASYRTLGEPISLPICDDFENEPEGVYTLTSNYPTPAYYVLPEVDENNISDIIASFYARCNNPANGIFSVGIMSDPYNPDTYTEIQQIGQANGLSSSFNKFQVPLRNYIGTGKFITFRLIASSPQQQAIVQLDHLYLNNCGAINFRTAKLESEYITISWMQSGTPNITIEYGPMGFTRGEGTIIHPQHSPYTQEGLEPLTNYTFYINSDCGNNDEFCSITDSATFGIFTPIGGNSCIDPTNISSESVSCTYGTYNNPYEHQGIIDYGYNSPQSRHTIHFDTTERDVRTSGLLRTIPEGYSSSVRLGNWIAGGSSGAQAESITYSVDVDINNFDILLLKYAALLQDPNHDPTQQPRFKIQILDNQMNVINSECSEADFIANINLGWNRDVAHDVLWKDWTTVGIDMTPYNGQTIFIRFTTFDCGEGSHYGYAYFAMDCMLKNIHSERCGIVDDNTFTAPSGFNYYWYTDVDPDITFSTNQSITVPTNNNTTYLCDITFTENPNCYFTMSAFAGARFPLANFDYSYYVENCKFKVQLLNKSTISSDGINPIPTNEGCESAMWIINNHDTLLSYNPTITITQPGDHTITLYSYLSGGECVDSLTQTIHLEYPAHLQTIEGPTDRCINSSVATLKAVGGTSYRWLETAENSNIIRVSPDTTTTYHCAIIDTNGCPDTLTHTLLVHPIYAFWDTLVLCEQYLPYPWNDTTLLPNTHSGNYTQHKQSQYQCDSILHLNLTINPTTYSTYADTIIQNQLPWQYLDTSFNEAIEETTIVTTNHNGCDSVITYTLFVYPNKYTYFDTTICEQYLPIVWDSRPFEKAKSDTVILLGEHNVDSLIIRTLHTIASDTTILIDSVCIGSQYTFFDQQYSLTGTYYHTLQNWFLCDSIIQLNLLQLTYPVIDFDISYDCNSEEYTITGVPDVGNYYSWQSQPNDLSLLGQEHAQTIITSPGQTTTYALTVDYSPFGRCPSTSDTTLIPIIHVDALMEVTPDALTFSRHTFRAHDISIGSDYRYWYIDNTRLPENEDYLTYTADNLHDSVILSIEAYNALCRDTLTQIIPILKSSIYAPNVFTPDEPTNRTFGIKGTGIIELEVHIYNRDGSIVFHSNDINFQWDGTSNGNRCPQNTYVYKIHYKTEVTPTTWDNLVGSVLLLR